MPESQKPYNDNSFHGYVSFLFAFIGVALLIVVRIALFYQDWGDFSYFLLPWIERYREMTFFEGLGTRIGNYNPPYMYLLNIIARTGFSELISVKVLSVIFDFIIAFFVMKIVSLKTESLNKRILAFILALAIPTVIINSSMWAQCDAIYSAFAIGSVYFGLSRRSKLAYIFMGLAFSFKMQAVFLMPMLVVFVFMKRIRFSDCYMFFAVYIATLLPALIAGMPVNVVFSTYINQAGTYSELSLNIANIWQFVRGVPYENFMVIGLCIAALAVLGLLYFTWVNRERLVNNVDFVRLAYLFAVIMPFLLPKMHDRYYFLADVLSILVFLFDKRRWYVPLVSIFCSYLAYAWFMMGRFEILDFKIGAIAMLVIILVVLRDYVMALYKEKLPQ